MGTPKKKLTPPSGELKKIIQVATVAFGFNAEKRGLVALTEDGRLYWKETVGINWQFGSPWTEIAGIGEVKKNGV